ncbi:hypothetical protein PLESTB_000344900 [Pleodorina starrii]|uniref:Peptidase S9 prolyl oligopeptidase catalytic domain-containing protein n=1 Tax=Pleodorina starrii TaxID=330485 RepID=A0A9W6BDF9_9CHLO|nr:hypothetical protein PLESTM_000050000 [Pleodorina starrii]GLC50126.1 hypothetical protein PLESTB_000344900 [Pleodorina starrii]GLC73094.1 hypothetical protein PLESTF_001331500 [Pleodorina starrii]
MQAYSTGSALGARLARSRPFVHDVARACPHVVAAAAARTTRHSGAAYRMIAAAALCSRAGPTDPTRAPCSSTPAPLRLTGLRAGPLPLLRSRSLWRNAPRLSPLLVARPTLPGVRDAADSSAAADRPEAAAASTAAAPPTHQPLPLSPDTGGAPIHPTSPNGYKLPPPEIAAIVDAPAQPSLSYSPDRKTFLQITRPPSLPPIFEMSRPELKLAGLRVDPELYARSKMSYYLGISIVPATEVVPAPADKCRPLTGFPPGSWINYVSWSPDGTHIAFTVRSPGGPGDPPRGPLELWLADPATGACRPALRQPAAPSPYSAPAGPATPTPGSPRAGGAASPEPSAPAAAAAPAMPLGLPYRGLNTVFDDYAWLDDDTLVAAVLPGGLTAPPTRPGMPPGPKVSDNSAGKKAQNRTWPDLLKDEYDMALFEHYGVSELLRLDVRTGEAVIIGAPRMYIEVDPSPDGQYLLVTWLEKPYSTAVPCGRFPRRTQLWRRDGSLVRELAALPLAEDIPIAFNSCRPGPRGISWRDDAPAEVYWMEAQDGGDPAVEVSPRDVVLALAADDVAADPAVQPRQIAATDLRCGGVAWCDGDLAILFESWYKTRRSVWWRFAPDRPHEPKTVIFDRNYEDVYGDPGSPLTRRTRWGTYAIARVAPDPTTLAALKQAAAQAEAAAAAAAAATPPGATEAAAEPPPAAAAASAAAASGAGSKANAGVLKAGLVTSGGLASGEGTWLLMSGSGASPEGNKPFLDLMHLESGETHRLWQSSPPQYEVMGSIMSDTDPEAQLTVEGMCLMLSRESSSDPPQSFLTTLHEAGRRCEERRLTDFPHPYPQLRELRREVLRYPRSDGVMLTATLYLPPGYDQQTHGSLPCIVWAYPREYKTKEAAGQMRRSPHQFTSIGSTSPTLWLTRGYAVLDGPTLPIVADVQEEEAAGAGAGAGGDSNGSKPPEPNDTFVEQLTDGARAAVQEVVRRGVADPARVSVGGHSYGAFMTANLVAHAPDLFAAGIARTGAYNRTLTPFGFQNEERTLWQAPEVYTRMSPFMMADKISKPLLLIHGEDDNNPGTFPLQSERFYQALKGHGATCRLVLLPHEGHGYRAYESIMHTLYEQDQWIERYAGYGRLDPGYITDDTANGNEGSASD